MKGYTLNVKTQNGVGYDYANVLAANCMKISAEQKSDDKHIAVFRNSVSPTSKKSENEYNILVYGIPRHAGQLYEAIFCLLLFVFFFWLWKNKRHKFTQGFAFGLFCVLLFSFRFVVENLKENQVAFEDSLPLNMGQILSIPFVVIGIGVMIWSKKRNKYHIDKSSIEQK
jgi:prolipoprotein diacylglyceryltransferase